MERLAFQYKRLSYQNHIHRLKIHYNPLVQPPLYFSVGSRFANILHARLRQNCSSLNCDLFRCNLNDSCYCDCGNYVESCEHFFLHCKRYVLHRTILLNKIVDLNLQPCIDIILYGNPNVEYDTNCQLFTAVHKYILDSRRFV